MNLCFFFFVFSFLSSLAFGSQGEAGFDGYGVLAQALHIDVAFLPAFSAVLSVPLLLLFGFFYKKKAHRLVATKNLQPKSKMDFFAALDLCLDFLYDMAKDTCGHSFVKFLPLLSTLFFCVFLSNVSGLIPGFSPSTGNFSMNLSLGVLVFLSYNWAGFEEHGIGYVKQFMGPFALMAPLFLCLELVSHCARPLSLAFRLTANIFGDHLILSVFSGLVPLFVPVFLLFFGLLVACVQSFVFTLLTGIYISMAVSHDH